SKPTPSAAPPKPARSIGAPSFEFGSSAPAETSKLSPKLLVGIGGALVVVIGLSVGIFFYFSGSSQPKPPAVSKPAPVVKDPQTETPDRQPSEPAPKNPPVGPVQTTPQTTPAPTEPNDVPQDTAGLVKYSLDEVKKTIERVQKEMPESDPRKEGFMQRLTAFKQELDSYASTGRADGEARGYAESARSQLKSMRQQLDQLPPAPSKGRK